MSIHWLVGLFWLSWTCALENWLLHERWPQHRSDSSYRGEKQTDIQNPEVQHVVIQRAWTEDKQHQCFLWSQVSVSVDCQKPLSPLLYSAIIRISQEINTESDSEAKCRNYPDEEYQSYMDCDTSFVHDELKERQKIVPFWATDNLEEVTQTYVEPMNLDLYDLFDGTISSPCFTPCLSTKVILKVYKNCLILILLM